MLLSVFLLIRSTFAFIEELQFCEQMCMNADEEMDYIHTHTHAHAHTHLHITYMYIHPRTHTYTAHGEKRNGTWHVHVSQRKRSMPGH